MTDTRIVGCQFLDDFEVKVAGGKTAFICQRNARPCRYAGFGAIAVWVCHDHAQRKG